MLRTTALMGLMTALLVFLGELSRGLIRNEPHAACFPCYEFLHVLVQ